jgi:hypothetical protein
MFRNCDRLREANRHVVESRARVAVHEARAAERAGRGDRAEDAITRLEEARLTLRQMERYRDILLWDHARGS